MHTLNWSQSVTPSEKVVIALIRSNQAFIRCLDEMKICNQLPDEMELVDYLIWNKLIPIFYTSIIHNKLLDEYFTSDFLEELKALYRVSILKHLNLESVFRIIAPLLHQEGINFIAFKGIVLSQQVYATPSLRPMLDIDILVSPADLNKAKTTLLDLGAVSMYEVESKHTMGKWRHLPPLVYRDIPIELHQQLFLSHEESYLTEAEIIPKLVPEQIYETSCEALSPEHHLFYLIYHLHKHVMQDYIRLIWLLDIRLFWEKYQATFHMKEFKEILDRTNGVYNSSLDAIQKILDITIIEQPEGPDKQNNDEMVLQYLSRCNSKGHLKQRIKSVKAIQKIHGIKNKLWFISGRLFPNPSYVASKYKISHQFLIPLYYPKIYAGYFQKLAKVLWSKVQSN